MSIFQPRRENVSTWTITVAELEEWAEKTLRPKAELAFKGEGEFNPGPWCTFSNIEQQSLEFVKYTLDPWVIRWEQSIQRVLLTPGEKESYFVKFNLEGLLRGDYQSRMNGYAIGRQNGWMSANDIRELENLDRIPAEEGGDLYLINGKVRYSRHQPCYQG